MQLLNSSSRTILGFAVVISAWSQAALCQSAFAQDIARVEKVQRTVEKRTDTAPKWSGAKVGTVLAEGENLRTGKRSKSDIRFSDKSLLRLGQLSSVEIRGPREMRLAKGQLLFSALSPARILAGSAAAAIKGTVPLIKVSPNGDAEFALYSGEVELTTPQGTRTLRPGEWIKVYADGRFSPTRSASPFLYMHNGKQLDLLLPPRHEPFAGGHYDNTARERPDRQLFDTTIGALSRDANFESYNPLISRSSGRPSPSPTTPPGTGGGTVPGPTPTVTPPPTGNTAGIGIDTGTAIDEVDETAATMRSMASAIQAPEESTSTTSASASTGEEHLAQSDPYLGSVSMFDTRVLGGAAFGSGLGDGNLLAGRIGFGNARGRLYTDLAITPLRLRSGSTTRDTVLITQAMMLYRTEKFDLQFGRQRVLDGPMQASIFGSMLRQGGRTTFDAVRLSSAEDSDLKYDLVYLVDAAPRQFVADAPGRQRGWYGRVEKRDDKYAVGLNLLRFNNAPVSSTTGGTVDFVIPFANDGVEVYGEIGRDPFRRKTQAFGMTFPALYDKAGIDLFLETSRLKSSSTAFGPNREYSARAYKELGSHWNMLAGVSKFQGGNTRFVLGFTVGATKVERDDAFSTLLSP